MTWTTRPRSELGGLSAIVAGSGQDIVLLHGVGLRAEAWNAQSDALAKRYRVTAIDLPGHGESLRLEIGQTLADYVRAIGAVLPAQSLIVGHSFGAMIAVELAHQNPDRIKGVVALNAVQGRTHDAKHAVQARAKNLNGHTNSDPEPTLRRWFGSGETPIRAACRDWLSHADPAGYKTAYTVFAHSDGPTETHLGKLTCPALFMTGAEEPNSTPAMSRNMAAATAHGQVRIVKGAAHMMPMTHPDAVNSALFDFASEVLE